MADRDPVTGRFAKGQSRDHTTPIDAPEPADAPWWQVGLIAAAVLLIVVAVLIVKAGP